MNRLMRSWPTNLPDLEKGRAVSSMIALHTGRVTVRRVFPCGPGTDSRTSLSALRRRRPSPTAFVHALGGVLIVTAPLSVVHFGVLYLPWAGLSTDTRKFVKPARGRGGEMGKLWGNFHRFSALPRRWAMATTTEDRAKRAMALGMTIRLLNRSVSPHTRSLDMVVPRKMNTRASTP